MTAFEAVDRLDFRLGRGVWDFAGDRAADIEAHWRKRLAEQPRLFNGRVLMLGRHAVEARGGERVLRGEWLEADFAAFLAWREFGFPAANACNGFSMAALRGADGGFLLGEMAPHTASADSIYFAAGTPDRQDVFGDAVDFEASAKRELFEEMGVRAEEAEIAPGWTVGFAQGRVACMKAMRLAIAAEAAKARIEDWLAGENSPEFARIHIVRGASDFCERMPVFVRDFLAHVFAAESR